MSLRRHVVPVAISNSGHRIVSLREFTLSEANVLAMIIATKWERYPLTPGI
jgi:hypothetical protein